MKWNSFQFTLYLNECFYTFANSLILACQSRLRPQLSLQSPGYVSTMIQDLFLQNIVFHLPPYSTLRLSIPNFPCSRIFSKHIDLIPKHLVFRSRVYYSKSRNAFSLRNFLRRRTVGALRILHHSLSLGLL